MCMCMLWAASRLSMRGEMEGKLKCSFRRPQSGFGLGWTKSEGAPAKSLPVKWTYKLEEKNGPPQQHSLMGLRKMQWNCVNGLGARGSTGEFSAIPSVTIIKAPYPKPFCSQKCQSSVMLILELTSKCFLFVVCLFVWVFSREIALSWSDPNPVMIQFSFFQ